MCFAVAPFKLTESSPVFKVTIHSVCLHRNALKIALTNPTQTTKWLQQYLVVLCVFPHWRTNSVVRGYATEQVQFEPN